jgi:flagellar motility protein MotE (MotC chaperone)
MEDTVQKTEEIVEKNTAAIRDLERRIEDLKNVIEERKKFQNTQNTSIEYEIQKVISIVDFIKPKK